MNVRDTPRAVARTVEWEFAQSTYAAVLAETPPALFPYWAETAHREFPGIPRDASFYAQSAEGLMIFFDCVAAAGRPCALPSRAADSVWHAWARMDASSLDRFCTRHFGKTIPHLEKARMQGAMGGALATCLVQARRRASKPPAGPDLPRLFTLDLQLGMPSGFGYRVIGGRVACSPLDQLGRPAGRPSFPRALMPTALLQAGLISQAEYAQAREARDASGDAGGAAAGCDGDAGCGDGGSGCSGGCGGGCGGG
ncbi:hypothetical protein [Massilia sp. IC2-476]|uniref:hypothetical protein n=1 Tax=Massilia sp. IC2-476 TaxID=2887199 RepID=UPI001D10ED12|nr:hypothetical protein [Massilia sp. IC2-476]MCC2973137.1 hypothetical protein [Massilia sp. IC2-476]